MYVRTLIRPAITQDVPALYAVETAGFTDEDGTRHLSYPLFFFRQAVDALGEFFFAAEIDDGRNDDGRIVGHALGAATPRGSIGWILNVVVHPQFRKHKVGRDLTLALIRALESSGLSCIRLSVEPDNIPAIALYRKLGFSELGREESYFGGTEARLVMQRQTSTAEILGEV